MSRAIAKFDEELEAWRMRRLVQVTYLVLDAHYEKVREGGREVLCAILTAIGALAGRIARFSVSVARGAKPRCTGGSSCGA